MPLALPPSLEVQISQYIIGTTSQIPVNVQNEKLISIKTQAVICVLLIVKISKISAYLSILSASQSGSSFGL